MATSCAQNPISKITINGREFDVYTLPSYNTPYYYVKELGSVNHFMTVRRLANAIKRAIANGKI